MTYKSTAKRLTGGIVAVVLLIVALCVTTFALIWANVSVENSLFHTGKVELNLNDGKSIIHEDEFLFEPGMTVEKDFFVQNSSTCSVYYRLYLNDVSGGLADVLQISIKDGDTVLYRGTANELAYQNATAADDILQINEKKNLTLVFYFPEDKGNETQNLDLSLTMCADATQTKNNPNKLFD